jgi:chorismate synthase
MQNADLQPSTFDLRRSTNRAGGIEGGISNGQPIIIRAAMKPIATTLLPQPTVDLASGTESPTKYERSDFCPVPRAVPILEAMVAFVLADALLEKIGGDSINEMKPRFESLRKATLDDLPMDNFPHVFWE